MDEKTTGTWQRAERHYLEANEWKRVTDTRDGVWWLHPSGVTANLYRAVDLQQLWDEKEEGPPTSVAFEGRDTIHTYVKEEAESSAVEHPAHYGGKDNSGVEHPKHYGVTHAGTVKYNNGNFQLGWQTVRGLAGNKKVREGWQKRVAVLGLSLCLRQRKSSESDQPAKRHVQVMWVSRRASPAHRHNRSAV